MLLISTDGRKAALDLRLVDQDATQTGPVKLDAVASRILEHWEQTRGREYRDDTVNVSPVRGSLQMVFSDLVTPNERSWEAYNELKIQHIQVGMHPNAARRN